MLHEALRGRNERQRMALLADLREFSRRLEARDEGMPELALVAILPPGEMREIEGPAQGAVANSSSSSCSDSDDSEDSLKSEERMLKFSQTWRDEDDAAWSHFWRCTMNDDSSWIDNYLTGDAAAEVKALTQRPEDPSAEMFLGGSIRQSQSVSFTERPDDWSLEKRSAKQSPSIVEISPPQKRLDTVAANALINEYLNAVKPSKIVHAGNTPCVHCGWKVLDTKALPSAAYTGVPTANLPPPRNVPPHLLSALDHDMWHRVTELARTGKSGPTIAEKVAELKKRFEENLASDAWKGPLEVCDREIRRAKAAKAAQRLAVQKVITTELRELKVMKHDLTQKEARLKQLCERMKINVSENLQVNRELVRQQTRLSDLQASRDTLEQEERNSEEEEGLVAAAHAATLDLQGHIETCIAKLRELIELRGPQYASALRSCPSMKLEVSPDDEEPPLKSNGPGGHSRYGSRCQSCHMLWGYSLFCPVTGRPHPGIAFHRELNGLALEDVPLEELCQRRARGAPAPENCDSMTKKMSVVEGEDQRPPLPICSASSGSSDSSSEEETKKRDRKALRAKRQGKRHHSPALASPIAGKHPHEDPEHEAELIAANAAEHVATFCELLKKLTKNELVTMGELDPIGYQMEAVILNQLLRTAAHSAVSSWGAAPRSTKQNSTEDAEVRELKKSIDSLKDILRYVNIPIRDLLKRSSQLEYDTMKFAARIKQLRQEVIEMQQDPTAEDAQAMGSPMTGALDVECSPLSSSLRTPQLRPPDIASMFVSEVAGAVGALHFRL